MKKVLAILLAIMLMATMLPFSVFAEEEDTDGYDGNFNPADTTSAQNLAGSGALTIGALFTTVGPTTRIAVGCPSWNDAFGSLTVTLYKWDTNYEKTTKSEPIEKKEFVDFEDNEHLGFDFNPALEAGSYYIELSDGYDNVGTGVGVWTGAGWPGQAVFVDGRYNDSMSIRMTVNYVTEPEGNVYGAIPEFEKEKSPLGGDSPWPSSYYIIMKEDDNADTFSGTGSGIEGTVSEDGNLLLTVAAGAVDSQYPINFDDMVSCQEYPVMALRVRRIGDANVGNGEAFFYTSTTPGASGGYSGIVAYDHETEDWQTVVIDGRANALFVNNALDGDDWMGMRFDVLNGTPANDFQLEIEWIAFFQSTEAAMAFDGDFSAIPTPEPTPTPTATPEATPTAEPTKAPANDNADATKAPADDDNKSSGCGSVLAGGFAVVAIMAGGVMLLGKKKRK